MAAEYTHTTLAQLRDQLAARLGDAGFGHWSAAELDLYISSTLSRWGLYTGMYRARGTFATSANITIYDLAAQPTLAAYLSHTRTDRDELGLIQYMLLEPYDPIDGTGMSEQLTFAQLVAALQRARDQFLSDTLHEVSTLSIVVDPSEGPPVLPDTTIAVRRAIWLSQDGARSNIHRSDEHEATAYSTTYPIDPGIPELFAMVGSPQLSLRLIPPPIDTGTLELLVATTGPTLDPGSAATALGVADDMCWIVRAAAIADLLARDGPAYDPSRAAYCRAEYEFGVSLALRAPMLLSAELDGLPTLPSSLADIDYAYAAPHWQSAASGSPTDIGVAGGDLIALRPVPDGSSHSVTVDVVRKAPQPTAPSSPLQIPREDLAAVLDGAEALALFKLGGPSIDDAVRLSKQMLTAAMRYNSRLSVRGYADAMAKVSQAEEMARPSASSSGGGSGVGAVAAQSDAEARKR